MRFPSQAMPASEDESQRQEVSRLLADWSKAGQGERAKHTVLGGL
jgi:hypothetical protein